MVYSHHAILQEHDGRSALLFERVLAYPPERVWRALTSNDELCEWHPTPFELEPWGGGRVSYRPGPDVPAMPDGTVLEYDAPRVLSYTWGEDELRWELVDHDDGCLLRLTHAFDDRFKAGRDAAGWHLCLRALSRSLESDERAQRTDASRLPSGWQQLNREYEELFGISREQATPPPSI